MKYKADDIDSFLGSLKNIPVNVPLVNVHQLINNPEIEARLPETNTISTSKIIAMTTIIGAVVTLSLLWPFSGEESREDKLDHHELPKKEVVISQPEVFEKKETNNKSHRLNDEVFPAESTDSRDTKRERIVSESADSYCSELVIPSELKECNWPDDTILDGNKLMLRLTLDDLKKLGFLIVQNDGQSGLFYRNEFNGIVSSMHKETHKRDQARIGSASSPSSNVAHANLKKTTSKNDYYPVFESDFTMDPIGYPELIGKDWINARDTLVPIILDKGIIPGLISEETTTIWFKISQNFFSKLPEQYTNIKDVYSCIKLLKDRTGRVDIVNYSNSKVINPVNVVELPKAVMEEIGFIFSDDKIVFTQNENQECRVKLTMGKGNGVSVGGNQTDLKPTPYRVTFLSNEKGRQQVKWLCGSDPQRNKFQSEYFLSNYNLLIPVLIRKDRFPDILHENIYLWFKPTEEFLKIIPGEQGDLIRQEYRYLVADNKEALEPSCGFFEDCQSTLHIHDLNLFPNPTSGHININFTLPVEEKVNISLADMNGVEVRKLKENEIFAEGIHALDFDVSEFPSGIYLLVIRGRNGYTSKRVLIQK